MALNASAIKGGGNNTPPLEAGAYPGRVVQIIDLGLQPQEYNGEKKAPAREVMLTYELSDEFLKDKDGEDQVDKPRWISETMALHNLKSEKAKSTLRIKVLDPENKYNGDLTKMLETPVSITIVKNKTKKGHEINNVAGLSVLRKRDADRMPPLVNAAVFFDLDWPVMEIYKKFPEWIQKKITSNLEYNGSPLQKMLGEAAAEDKPAQDNKLRVELDEEDAPF